MVKCYRGGGEKMENPQMHAYTLPWSEYALDDLFSSSNIESREMKKKIYIPLNYWGFYFERRMWLWVWMCGGKGMAIRCGNHETKNVCPYPYSLSLSFDCFSLFFSFLWKVYWIHRYNKKKKRETYEKLLQTHSPSLFFWCVPRVCGHVTLQTFANIWNVLYFSNWVIPFAYTCESVKQQEKIS